MQPGDHRPAAARAAAAAVEALVMSGTVTEGVERDLAEIAKGDEDLAKSGLAMTALALAAEMDDPGNSATSKSMCARALTGALAELRAMNPPKLEDDEIERARKRRAKRLAGKPAAGASASS